MGLLDLFFRRTLQDIEEKTTKSFENIKEDMGSVAAWIRHFNERNEVNESEISSMKADLESLKEEMNALQGQVKDKTGQDRTRQDISKDKTGQVKDMSFAKKEAEKQKEIEIFDKSGLAGSHLELMALLYHCDRPLSYEEISNRLNKTEKSIRNLIYEMRCKGVDISDKSIGLRQKGFYLTKEAKIKVSGR